MYFNIYMYKIISIVIVFLLGLYFITHTNNMESFEPKLKTAENCPDVLIQKGSEMFLYNTKRAEIPGVNPIKFANLEEYIEFTEWQRSQGILCPILYLQHSFDAQGESVYKARPSPTNLMGGLPNLVLNSQIMPPPQEVPIIGSGAELPPSGCKTGVDNSAGIILGGSGKVLSDPTQFDPTRTDIPYNQNSYPAFDQQNQYIGLDTPLDKMFRSNSSVSPNPMDDHWGGAKYTDSLIDAGYYKDNEVNR